jgi:hypothetical protein
MRARRIRTGFFTALVSFIAVPSGGRRAPFGAGGCAPIREPLFGSFLSVSR